MSQTVAILPGIFSGPHTTKRLGILLQRAGYKLTDDTTNADILLAHSAGPLWLPAPPVTSKIVLINPPYWPGKSIRERTRARVRSNSRFYTYGVPLNRWLARQLWGVYYVMRNPQRTRYVFRHIAAYDLRQTLASNTVILVRNEHDDWLTPELTELKRQYPGLKIVDLPGEHDDFNYHPDRYVELLQSLTGGS